MCPVVPDDQVGSCTENCDSDESCPGEQMCCSNGCGHSCVMPVPGMLALKMWRKSIAEIFYLTISMI